VTVEEGIAACKREKEKWNQFKEQFYGE